MGVILEIRGHIIILNGAPRSGKSSIARAIQASPGRPWMNLGVDAYVKEIIPPQYHPGLGLRPGGERPDLEIFVLNSYLALYQSIAAHSRLGLNVVADVGHHDAYATPLNILARCADVLTDFSAMFVGVRCPVEEIMDRRNNSPHEPDNKYVRGSGSDPIPAPVLAWQREVHNPGIYDLEVDTSVASPEVCAATILRRLNESEQPFEAFPHLAMRAYVGRLPYIS